MKDRITGFIEDSVYRYGYSGALIGISGGIDSAVVGALAVEALGKDRVFGLLLPERDSSPETVKDSLLVVKHLGIDYSIKRIGPILRKLGTYSLEPPAWFIPQKIREKYVRGKWEKLAEEDPFLDDLRDRGKPEFLKGLAYYRSKHRIRMCCLYLEAELRRYAVLGTTNLTEYRSGFYVKWGDNATDIEPIMHLYKTQVYKLARALNVPERIIVKPPSPDLVPGVTDEFVLGMGYAQFDRILMKLDNNESPDNEPEEMVNRVKKILDYARKREVKMLSLRK